MINPLKWIHEISRIFVILIFVGAFANTSWSATEIDSIFAQDVNAWVIVSNSQKPSRLKESEWIQAVGAPESCGIACFDAYVRVCNRSRDGGYEQETFFLSRAQLNAESHSKLMKLYRARYQEKFSELQKNASSNAARLKVCEKLNAQRRYLSDQHSANDPVVRYIKKTGHSKFVRRAAPRDGLRQVFYSFGPAEGGTFITSSYRRKLEKKLKLVIYYRPKKDIAALIDGQWGFLARGKKQFEEVFGNIARANLTFERVESETAAVAAVKAVRAKWKIEIPKIPVSEQKVSQVREAAQKGDANAQFTLGKLYETGTLAKAATPRMPDYDSAAYWYEKAAGQGHMFAQTELGVFHYKGNGRLNANARTAVSYFQESAKQGDALAMYNLGLVYADGRHGVEYSFDTASSWFLKAAEAGDWYQEAGIANDKFIAERARKSHSILTKQQIARNRAKQKTGSARCDTVVGISCNAGVDLLGAHIYMNIK